MRNRALWLGLIFSLLLVACREGEFPSSRGTFSGSAGTGVGLVPFFDAGPPVGQAGQGTAFGPSEGPQEMFAGTTGSFGPIEEPGVCPLEPPADGEQCIARRLRCVYGVIDCSCGTQSWSCLGSEADLDAGLDIDMDAGDDDDDAGLP